MPRVPVLSNTQVASTPERPAARPAGAYLGDAQIAGAIGQGIQQVAATIDRHAQAFDEIRVNAADVRLRQAQTSLLYDPKDGALFATGENAPKASERVQERWRRTVGEIEADLSGERQKALFRARAQQLEEDTNRRVMVHVGNEIRKVDAASHEALVTNELESIATEAGNASWVDAAIGRLTQQERLYADRNGLPAEVVKRRVETVTSKARLAQVAQLADTDPERAQAILTGKGDQLLAADKEQAQRLVEQGSLSLRSQRERDRIIAAHPDDERAALAEARKLEGAMEDATVQRITQHFAEQRRLTQERDRAFAEEVAAQVEETGSVTGLTAAQVTRAKAIPGLWKSLTMRAKQVANQESVTTDWEWYEKYVNLSDDDLRAANPVEYRPHLSDADFKEFLNRKAMVQGTGGRGRRDFGLTPSELFAETLARARQSGLVGANVRTAGDLNKNAREKETFTRVHDAINAQVSAAMEEKGAPLTEAEMRGVITAVFDDAVLRTKGFNRVVPRAALEEGTRFRELTPEERAERPRALPPARAGESRRDRYLTLLNAGLTPEDAEAQVLRERPNP